MERLPGVPVDPGRAGVVQVEPVGPRDRRGEPDLSVGRLLVDDVRARDLGREDDVEDAGRQVDVGLFHARIRLDQDLEVFAQGLESLVAKVLEGRRGRTSGIIIVGGELMRTEK